MGRAYGSAANHPAQSGRAVAERRMDRKCNPFMPRAADNESVIGCNPPTSLTEASFIDVHYHANPDAYHRRYGASQAANLYGRHGGWVVLKNHLGCTAAQAWESRSTGLPVSGSVVLNEIVGGIAWRVVERSLSQIDAGNGRLIVHLPTVTGRPHQSRLARTISHPILANRPIGALTISDGTGALVEGVMDILRLACDNPVVISSGHASRDEVYRLVEGALRLNVPRLMLNQPANPMTGLTAAELKEIASTSNVYIEQCALTYLLGYQPVEDFAAVLAEVDNVIYSSDLGQPSQPDIDEWIASSRGWFSRSGLSEDRIDQITRKNPLEMLS